MKRYDPFAVALVAFAAAFAIFTPMFNQIAVQAATPLQAGVDVTPVANNVIQMAVAVLTVAAGVVSTFAVKFLSSKTRMTDTAFEKLMADRVNDILLRAIDYAEMWAKTQVADPNSALRDVRVDNMFVRVAVEYAIRSMPDLVKYFGLTPERITDMVKARLNAFVAPPQENSGVVSTVPQSMPS